MDDFKQYGLKEELIHCCKKMGWKYLSEIQKTFFMKADIGNDLIIISKHGGKSAFPLYIVNALHHISNPRSYFACIICKTSQEVEEVDLLFDNLGCSHTYICGTLKDSSHQLFSLIKNPHVITTTSIGMQKLLEMPQFVKNFKNIKYLVFYSVDEEEDCLCMDTIMNFSTSKKVYAFTSKENTYVKKYMHNPEIVEVKEAKVSCQFIPVQKINRNDGLRYILREVVDKESSVAIFTEKIDTIGELVSVVESANISYYVMKETMVSKADLIENLHKFKEGDYQLVICTDWMNHIFSMFYFVVDFIINYGVPEKYEKYDSRLGRVARAGGRILSLVDEEEKERLMRFSENTTELEVNLDHCS